MNMSKAKRNVLSMVLTVLMSLSLVLCGAGAAGVQSSYALSLSDVSLPNISVSDIKVPEISVTINGKTISFDQAPIIESGRTLVPLRTIFEALGASVDWYPETKTVVADWGKNSLTLDIGSKELRMGDGTVIAIDVPAKIMNGRTLVPLRAISEAMECKVDWDGLTRKITITSILPEGLDWTYINERFGFEFKVPEGFEDAGGSDNGDGTTLINMAKGVILNLWASYYPGMLDLDTKGYYQNRVDYYKECGLLKASEYYPDLDAFSLVILDEPNETYQFTCVRDGVEYTYMLNYPLDSDTYNYAQKIAKEFSRLIVK